LLEEANSHVAIAAAVTGVELAANIRQRRVSRFAKSADARTPRRRLFGENGGRRSINRDDGG
jgi:hypothetical protein